MCDYIRFIIINIHLQIHGQALQNDKVFHPEIKELIAALDSRKKRIHDRVETLLAYTYFIKSSFP